MQTTMMNWPLRLEHILDRMRTLTGGQTVVWRDPAGIVHRQTYARTADRAARLAGALRALGLERGAPVATLMWNNAAHLEAYLGVPLAGGVVHTMNPRLSGEDLGWIMADAGDRILIVDHVLLPVLERISPRPPLDHVIVVGGEPAGDGALDYDALVAGAEPAAPLPAPLETDAAAMCYTSGTTGRPKGVVYSHRSLMLQALVESLPDQCGIGCDEVVMPVTPMFHVNAWCLPFATTLTGAKLVLPGPRLDAASVLDLLAGEAVTLACAVPTVWLAVADALEKEPARWRLQPPLPLLIGGSACPEALIRRLAALGIAVLHAWGMTETSPVASLQRLGKAHADLDDDRRFGLIARQGPPLPLVELRALDGNGTAVAADGAAMGELELRGPWVTGGYHRNAGSDAITADGWFRTGDIVTLHADGAIQITDRVKDLVKSGGEWISSIDLENALMRHPAIAEAAVVAVPHPKWSERPLAVIVVRQGATVTGTELRAFLAAHVVSWQIPDAFVEIDAIPRTATGKFLKTALRQRFATWDWDSPSA